MINTGTQLSREIQQAQADQEVREAQEAFQIFLKICLATLWVEVADKDNHREDQILDII